MGFQDAPFPDARGNGNTITAAQPFFSTPNYATKLASIWPGTSESFRQNSESGDEPWRLFPGVRSCNEDNVTSSPNPMPLKYVCSV